MRKKVVKYVLKNVLWFFVMPAASTKVEEITSFEFITCQLSTQQLLVLTRLNCVSWPSTRTYVISIQPNYPIKWFVVDCPCRAVNKSSDGTKKIFTAAQTIFIHLCVLRKHSLCEKRHKKNKQQLKCSNR